eukprot:9031325-Lingulodinium_polyedra.AAC.1
MDPSPCEPDGQPLQPFTVPVLCDLCQIWLNGHDQWEEHVVGRKHRLVRARFQPRYFSSTRKFLARESARSFLLLVHLRCSAQVAQLAG